MIIYNTTYVMPNGDARDFVIWVHEVLLPAVTTSGDVHHGRLSRILSHKEDDSECFSVQLEAESTAHLHRWVAGQGRALNDEMLRLFDGRVAGFGTLLEVIDGE